MLHSVLHCCAIYKRILSLFQVSGVASDRNSAVWNVRDVVRSRRRIPRITDFILHKVMSILTRVSTRKHNRK